MGEPGVGSLPTGIAERLIHASHNGNTNSIARLNFELWKRDLAGTETLLRNGYSEQFSNQSKAELRWTVGYATAFSLLTTDRLVFKVYAARVSGSNSFEVVTSYEGADVSYVKTTISAGAIGPQGATGATGATGGNGVQGATGAVGFRYYYNGNGASGSGNPTGNLWFKDGTNLIYINRTTADGIDAWGHFYTWKLLAGWAVDNGMLMIRRYGEQTPMRMVAFSAVGYTGTFSGLPNANNATYQYTLSNGVVTAGTFTHGETLDVYLMALQ